ncbi:short transient receptor potential channel 5-like isoform X2 [Anneissia japonica]|nr:short transient receptor potential channel 5-like isoform X2 [Anneissia japonica]XP_033110108.1 short transient receptor potential channel 5-like isoform X2 [Anneissia japonica]
MSLPAMPGGVEQLFIQAVQRGDRKAITFALANAPDLNINCVDSEGKTALVLAIQNGNSDIVKILLDNNIQLGDSLLKAVDEQFIEGVKLICEHSKSKNIPEALECRSQDGDFHPDITPLILAAHHNNFDIIKILLEFGANKIDAKQFGESENSHTLQHSVGMLNNYKAMASQAYISLTAEDPFNTAFELCGKLRQLSVKQYEFSDQFIELADQCETYAADLLNQIRDSDEQMYILNHDSYGWGTQSEDLTVSQPNRVKVAIHFEQRKFVAHPHCQQRLIEMWFHGLKGWRDQSSLRSTLLTILMAVSYPLLSVAYMLYPKGKLGKLIKIPYVKFLCHTASQLSFLLVLLWQTLTQNKIKSEDEEQRKQESKYEAICMVCIVLWVAGMTWQKCKELWLTGTRFFHNLWNMFDFVTLALYWSVIVLYVTVYIHGDRHIEEGTADDGILSRGSRAETSTLGTPNNSSISPFDVGAPGIQVIVSQLDMMFQQLTDMQTVQNDLAHSMNQSLDKLNEDLTKHMSGSNSYSIGKERQHMEEYDPRLVGEALFALAKTFSFLRMICLTVVSRWVGPMQISLGGMMFDIFKFLFIFSFVWFAFSLGMNQIYWYYSTTSTMPFGTVTDTMATLFWALFGLPDLKIISLPDKEVKHPFTETVGSLLYATYHVIAIVVLMNVLIAMMSNTYTRVEMDADIEWKFSRSKLWMSYFDELGTIAPPFNIIPTVKSIKRVVMWFCGNVCCRDDVKKQYKMKLKTILEERQARFKEVSLNLVKRYQFEKRHQEDDDDEANILNELKQDISGFKYDMFEALNEMDKKIKQVDAKVNNKEIDDDDIGLGGEMFKALKSAVKEEEIYDSIESLNSGCSGQMLDMKSKPNNPDWFVEEDDMDMSTAKTPIREKQTDSTKREQPGLAGQFQYIDDEDVLGLHRNTSV